MNLIGQLVGTLFLSREVAHRAHLAVTGTGSFAKHSALGEFYPAVGDHGDMITEAYQGRHGIIEIPYLKYDDDDGDIIKCLEKYMDDIEELRYGAVDKKDTTIQNLIDDALATYLSTLYKLRHLK
jgi:DNA-binding ferritin-like protein